MSVSKAQLGEVVTQYTEYVEAPEPRMYPKLSVKLYGKGVVLDTPVDGSALKMQRHQLARAGQVILSEIWGKKGAIGFVPPEGNGALCTSHFFLFDVNTSRVHSGWLQAIFRANYLEEQLGSEARGTTGYAAVRPKTLLACEIPLPPLDVQQQMVARVEALASKAEEAMALHQQIVRQAEALKISLHLTSAQGRIVSLGDILELQEDAVRIDPLVAYPQVGVKSFGCGLFPKEAIMGTETTYKRFNRLFAGALVLSQVKGWEGAIAVCPPGLDGWFVSPEYRTFKCRDGEVDPAYLEAIVPTEWFWKAMTEATRGVGDRRERTRPEQFLRLEMPWPTLDRQKRAIEVFQRLKELRRVRQDAFPQWEALLPAFLQQVFSAK